MTIGSEICNALGLVDKGVTRIQMDFEHDKAEIVVTFVDLNATSKDGKMFVEVIKKYDLVERKAE